MPKERLRVFLRTRTDALLAVLIFCITLYIFWVSPIYQVSDSHYSMLLSESLLHHGTFKLDGFAIPRGQPVDRGEYVMIGNAWQLELMRDHIYYFFPPGSSVLSLPYVALMNKLGISASNVDGTYSREGEVAIETSLAALLMALLASIFFYAARLILPAGWSLLIAFSGALGTQVWSTASRGLWSDTWGIFLLGIAVLMLLAHESGSGVPPVNHAQDAHVTTRVNPIILATLLAWTYFVRPTNAVHIIAISVFIFLYHRKLFVKYAITGAIWFAGFVLYSWHNFHQLLPNYYQANRLYLTAIPKALSGTLISPSRGLLIFVPVLLFVAYILIRYREHLALPRLLWLALAIVAGHVLATCGFLHWWGGSCYGPRLMTGLVPWFVLLGILGVRAMLDAHRKRKRSRLEWGTTLAAGTLLLLLSVFINARGALAFATVKWYDWPVDVERAPYRLWDWRQAQFLAGLLRPPLPREFPPADSMIDFSQKEADKYLWYGWSGIENDFRWTDEKEAAVIFALDNLSYTQLRIALTPFLASGKLAEQRMIVSLNRQPIGTLEFTEEQTREYVLTLPAGALQHNNILTFKLPNATSPRALRMSIDQRQLGIAAQWMRLQP
jgi:hypothetical protein